MNIVCFCNFTEAKSHEVSSYSFTGQDVISQKPNDTCKKQNLHLALEYIKTVDLDYRSSLLVAQLVRFWFKSLQSLTAHERQFLQGDLFLLTVCTHKVPLYLCSIFCSPSVVQVSTASYPVWNAVPRGHVPSPFGILRSMRNGRSDDKSEGR